MKLFKIITLLSFLFCTKALADGALLGGSTTTANPHIAGTTQSGWYTDGTNILSTIAGTNITSITSSGYNVNGYGLFTAGTQGVVVRLVCA